MNKEILFITGHRRCGTTMLTNLFDKHESFCVYPCDLGILYAYYPNYIGKSFSYKYKKDKIISIIESNMNSVINEKKFFKKFNLNKFLKEIKKNITLKNIDNISKLTNLVINTYVKILKPKNNFKYIVIKETSVSLFAFKIKEWFKKIKFIQIVRDPRDNYASLKAKHKDHYSKTNEDKQKLLASLINRARIDFKFSNINDQIIGKKFYKTIKYENLVKKPKKELKQICKFLSINFDKSLLYPSILGYKIIGNSHDKNNFSGIISSLKVNKWKRRINLNDAQVIEFFLEEEMKTFDYKFTFKKINIEFIHNFYNWYNKTYFFYDRFNVIKK